MATAPPMRRQARGPKKDEEDGGSSSSSADEAPSAPATGAAGVLCKLADVLEMSAGPRQSRTVVLVLVVLAFVVTPLLLLLLRPVPQPQCHAPPQYEPAQQPLDPPRYHGPAVEFSDRYTLILNSYKRPDLLQRAVARYSQCADIDAIRVVWCEGGLPPSRAGAPSFYSDAKEVRYDVMPSSSLNSRFWPVEGLRTEAVLSIDDDIVAPCAVLTQLFKAWQSHKRTLVGFYPRLHVVGRDCRYKYLMGFGTLTWHGRYSVVLTKAAMMHRDYLEFYSNHMPAGIREHVDKVRNCEDIAMQLLVTNATGLAPLFVHSARVVDLGKGLTKVKGISSGAKHSELRTECLNVFARYYGGSLPLVSRAVGEHADAPAWWLRASPLVDGIYSLFTGHI